MDTLNGESELAPFLNILNEMHARQTSKKVKAALKARRMNGAHISSFAPLGYMWDPEQKGHLLVDPETKWIVEKIFDMAVHGMGAAKIMKALIREKVPTPGYLHYTKEGAYAHIYQNAPEKARYAWNETKIRLILTDENYLGNSIHNKTSVKSFKLKKQTRNPVSEWVRVEGTHEAIVSKTFQQGRKPKNTWLAGKVKCGHCGYALKATHNPKSVEYFRCTKRIQTKGCPGCGKIRKPEFEEFIFNAMRARFKNFQVRHDKEEKANPKLTAYQIELAQVEAEIEKLLDTLTGANATLLAYANKKIEELDTRRQTISKAIAELSVETMSPQKEQELSYYLDHWDSIEFDDKRKAADGLIISISATSDHVQVEWKI